MGILRCSRFVSFAEDLFPTIRGRVFWQMVWPSTLTRKWRSESRPGHDYLHRQVLKHNRPDITLVHKDTQKWTLVDIAVPADQKIIRTEEEKVEKYQDLAFEIRRIHGASKGAVIPIVIGALGSISKRVKTWYDKLVVLNSLEVTSLSAILLTAHLLRKVLRLWTAGSGWDIINCTQ